MSLSFTIINNESRRSFCFLCARIYVVMFRLYSRAKMNLSIACFDSLSHDAIPILLCSRKLPHRIQRDQSAGKRRIIKFLFYLIKTPHIRAVTPCPPSTIHGFTTTTALSPPSVRLPLTMMFWIHPTIISLAKRNTAGFAALISQQMMMMAPTDRPIAAMTCLVWSVRGYGGMEMRCVGIV